jgi:MarR family transcriptional regulator, organic hydroperoxide resistance regulator
VQVNDFKLEMWSIMYQVKINMQKFVDPIVQSEGLNMFQAYILMRLSDGTVTNISSLCKEFGMNQGNVSTMCKQMEKAGLIKRIRSSEDERIVNLSLTEQGKQTIHKLHDKSNELNSVFEQFPSEKLEVIISGMNEFNKLLKLLSANN